ncbi:M56 family metallopeptidase [uncultured Algibacter sp.]|uniref:M56 family metallopeptidase n=1 Tax=uncultured Algibacter sp. TaxID=298659 RepID=UPI002622B7C6|nr:M56 family metallopeptidase [uncultured Algibacter sp.]
MLHYFLQTIAFQLFFLLIYDVFLQKETFFNWNRIYLNITAVLSIILPFIKINSLKSIMPKDYIVSLPEVVLGHTELNTDLFVAQDPAVINTNLPYWQIVFYIGVLVAVLIFLYKFTKVILLIFKNPKTNSGKLTLVKIINSNVAFSFFHFVFLGDLLYHDEKKAILKHEIIHVKQMHSLDLLFFEVLRVLFWFNPLVYMYQYRISSLHEFIADREAVKTHNKNQYYQSLLSQVFETRNVSFINPFFKQSLIKKRIIMLQKSKSKQVSLFKYVLLIPLVFGMLVYTSCENQNEINPADASDLSQYNYTLKFGEELKNMSEENKAIKGKHEAFFKANYKEYVSWGIKDEESKTTSYSIHSINDEYPVGLDPKLFSVHSLEGISYFRDAKFYRDYLDNRSALLETEKQKLDIPLKLKKEFKNEGIEVPFSVIENVPIFPGCELLTTNEERRDCMSKNISSHVNKNFNTKLADSLKLKGRQRINVIFKIDRNGDVVGVRSRAPHPSLEEEAIRVIKTLPKFKPGEQKGKTVNVPYSLPIVFQVAD